MDGSILDPDSARERIAAWKDRVDELAANTQAMGDRLQELRVTAADENGLVQLTIDSTGVLVDIQLTSKSQRTGPDVLSRTIMTTLAEARTRLADQSQEIITGTMGTESPAAQAISASINQRLRTTDTAESESAPKPPTPEDDEDYDIGSEFRR